MVLTDGHWDELSTALWLKNKARLWFPQAQATFVQI